MFSLEGKKALITGAAGGIGREIAARFHKAGAHVVITGTRLDVLDEVAAPFKDSRVSCIAADLSKSGEVIDLFKQAEELTSGLDIVVCNAGITKDNLLIRMSEEEYDDVLNVNLKSVWLLNREAMKAMTGRRKGRIINISSIVGQTGNFGQTNYAASKAGIIGLTKSAAQEGASRGVTVNAIAPGFISTPMTEVIRDDIKDKIRAKIPMGAFGEPSDIASAAQYLASDEARYVTGVVMQVNGGMYM